MRFKMKFPQRINLLIISAIYFGNVQCIKVPTNWAELPSKPVRGAQITRNEYAARNNHPHLANGYERSTPSYRTLPLNAAPSYKTISPTSPAVNVKITHPSQAKIVNQQSTYIPFQYAQGWIPITTINEKLNLAPVLSKHHHPQPAFRPNPHPKPTNSPFIWLPLSSINQDYNLAPILSGQNQYNPYKPQASAHHSHNLPQQQPHRYSRPDHQAREAEEETTTEDSSNYATSEPQIPTAIPRFASKIYENDPFRRNGEHVELDEQTEEEEEDPEKYQVPQDPTPISDHEHPIEIPTKPIYPGEGHWARPGKKYRVYNRPETIQRSEEEEEQRPDGYETFEDGEERFRSAQNQFRNNVNLFPQNHNLPNKYQTLPDDAESEPLYEKPEIGFVPMKTYAQVRKTETTRHLPQSEAIKEASTEEELINAPRLREVIKNTHAHIVYSEEGYEDSAYDHAGHEKKAENHEGYNNKEQDLETYKEKAMEKKNKKFAEEAARAYGKDDEARSHNDDIKEETEEFDDSENYRQGQSDAHSSGSTFKHQNRPPKNLHGSDSKGESSEDVTLRSKPKKKNRNKGWAKAEISKNIEETIIKDMGGDDLDLEVKSEVKLIKTPAGNGDKKYKYVSISPSEKKVRTSKKRRAKLENETVKITRPKKNAKRTNKTSDDSQPKSTTPRTISAKLPRMLDDHQISLPNGNFNNKDESDVHKSVNEGFDNIELNTTPSTTLEPTLKKKTTPVKSKKAKIEESGKKSKRLRKKLRKKPTDVLESPIENPSQNHSEQSLKRVKRYDREKLSKIYIRRRPNYYWEKHKRREDAHAETSTANSDGSQETPTTRPPIKKLNKLLFKNRARRAVNVRPKPFEIDHPDLDIDKLKYTIVDVSKFPEPRPKADYTFIKYPYYRMMESLQVNRHSPLRYAEDLRSIPVKTEGGMEFYESTDSIQCPEVDTEIDPIPDRIKNKELNNEEDTEGDEEGDIDEKIQPLHQVQRLHGLGDKIDCMKVKYFGEDPLDSPFFKEELIEAPSMDAVFKHKPNYFRESVPSLDSTRSASRKSHHFQKTPKETNIQHIPRNIPIKPQNKPSKDQVKTKRDQLSGKAMTTREIMNINNLQLIASYLNNNSNNRSQNFNEIKRTRRDVLSDSESASNYVKLDTIVVLDDTVTTPDTTTTTTQALYLIKKAEPKPSTTESPAKNSIKIRIRKPSTKQEVINISTTQKPESKSAKPKEERTTTPSIIQKFQEAALALLKKGILSTPEPNKKILTTIPQTETKVSDIILIHMTNEKTQQTTPRPTEFYMASRKDTEYYYSDAEMNKPISEVPKIEEKYPKQQLYPVYPTVKPTEKILEQIPSTTQSTRLKNRTDYKARAKTTEQPIIKPAKYEPQSRQRNKSTIKPKVKNYQDSEPVKYSEQISNTLTNSDLQPGYEQTTETPRRHTNRRRNPIVTLAPGPEVLPEITHYYPPPTPSNKDFLIIIDTAGENISDVPLQLPLVGSNNFAETFDINKFFPKLHLKIEKPNYEFNTRKVRSKTPDQVQMEVFADVLQHIKNSPTTAEPVSPTALHSEVFEEAETKRRMKIPTRRARIKMRNNQISTTPESLPSTEKPRVEYQPAAAGSEEHYITKPSSSNEDPDFKYPGTFKTLYVKDDDDVIRDVYKPEDRYAHIPEYSSDPDHESSSSRDDDEEDHAEITEEDEPEQNGNPYDQTYYPNDIRPDTTRYDLVYNHMLKSYMLRPIKNGVFRPSPTFSEGFRPLPNYSPEIKPSRNKYEEVIVQGLKPIKHNAGFKLVIPHTHMPKPFVDQFRHSVRPVRKTPVHVLRYSVKPKAMIRLKQVPVAHIHPAKPALPPPTFQKHKSTSRHVDFYNIRGMVPPLASENIISYSHYQPVTFGSFRDSDSLAEANTNYLHKKSFDDLQMESSDTKETIVDITGKAVTKAERKYTELDRLNRQAAQYPKMEEDLPITLMEGEVLMLGENGPIKRNDELVDIHQIQPNNSRLISSTIVKQVEVNTEDPTTESQTKKVNILRDSYGNIIMKPTLNAYSSLVEEMGNESRKYGNEPHQPVMTDQKEKEQRRKSNNLPITQNRRRNNHATYYRVNTDSRRGEPRYTETTQKPRNSPNRNASRKPTTPPTKATETAQAATRRRFKYDSPTPAGSPELAVFKVVQNPEVFDINAFIPETTLMDMKQLISTTGSPSKGKSPEKTAQPQSRHNYSSRYNSEDTLLPISPEKTLQKPVLLVDDPKPKLVRTNIQEQPKIVQFKRRNRFNRPNTSEDPPNLTTTSKTPKPSSSTPISSLRRRRPKIIRTTTSSSSSEVSESTLRKRNRPKTYTQPQIRKLPATHHHEDNHDDHDDPIVDYQKEHTLNRTRVSKTVRHNSNSGSRQKLAVDPVALLHKARTEALLESEERNKEKENHDIKVVEDSHPHINENIETKSVKSKVVVITPSSITQNPDEEDLEDPDDLGGKAPKSRHYEKNEHVHTTSEVIHTKVFSPGNRRSGQKPSERDFEEDEPDTDHEAEEEEDAEDEDDEGLSKDYSELVEIIGNFEQIRKGPKHGGNYRHISDQTSDDTNHDDIRPGTSKSAHDEDEDEDHDIEHFRATTEKTTTTHRGFAKNRKQNKPRFSEYDRNFAESKRVGAELDGIVDEIESDFGSTSPRADELVEDASEEGSSSFFTDHTLPHKVNNLKESADDVVLDEGASSTTTRSKFVKINSQQNKPAFWSKVVKDPSMRQYFYARD